MARKKDSKARRMVLSVLRYLVASVSLAIFFYVVFALFFSTEEERKLQKENRLYSNLYDSMKNREELISDVVEGLLDKDASIYEELFNTQPPSLEEEFGVGIRKEQEAPNRYYFGTVTTSSDSLMSLASRVEENFNEVFRMLEEKSVSVPPLSLPLRNMSYVQVGASVGLKQNALYGVKLQHQGLDLVAPQGAKVYAAGPGRVVQVIHSRRGLGNEVVVDHGNGYTTRYCLLGDISVSQGKSVSTGTVLGTVGVTNMVSAPHLHFEVHYNGEVKDPIDYFFASVSPEDYSRMRFMAAKTSQSMD